LLNAFPRADTDHEVVAIPGDPARFATSPDHCPFIERCPFSQPVCRERRPEPQPVAPGHWAACHFVGNAASMRTRAEDPLTWRPAEAENPAPAPPTVANEGNVA
jgi:oligopeptide/dipeptide ABC transporter ATP-binding protein